MGISLDLCYRQETRTVGSTKRRLNSLFLLKETAVGVITGRFLKKHHSL